MPDSQPTGIFAEVQQHRFDVLLGSLMLLMFSAPVVDHASPAIPPQVAHAIVAGIFVLLLLSAVLAVSENRRTAWIALLMVVPPAALHLSHPATLSLPLLAAAQVGDMFFLAFTGIVILRFVFAGNRVTFNRICASLCVYLLMGIIWANAYTLVDIFYPEGFGYSLAEQADEQLMEFGTKRTLYALYYSFVTLTTLGYGDIVPLAPMARMLAVLEAVIGQFYLTVLVARLVGLHISQSTAMHKKDA